MLPTCALCRFHIQIFSLLCAVMFFPIHAHALDPPSSPMIRQAIARRKHRLENLLARKNF